MNVSTLTVVPGALAPGTAPCAEPEVWPWVSPIRPTTDDHIHGHAPHTIATAARRGASDDYPEWLHHVRAAAGCTRPIRLQGQIQVRRRDGSIMATYHTEDMPDGTIYKACGNRRAAFCPACAEVYRRDTYHLIHAGLVGDRWGLPPLDHHIAVFVTATAPSFGPVHRHVIKTHACRDRRQCACRPEPCQPRRDNPTCPHGRPLGCGERHRADDHRLGQPLCLDCYDHNHQVVWNERAGDLWRRTLQQVDRELQRVGKAFGVQLRRSYAKVAEFQARGVVHFHALIRLDGVDPANSDAIVVPPPAVDRAALEFAVRHAFAKTAFRSDPHPANNGRGWRIGWGQQLDIRHVNAPANGHVTVGQVAGYLAKYATKSTEATGLLVKRIDDVNIGIYGDPGTHTGRLVQACWDLGTHPAYARLRQWAHMLGYGGHFSTKSRRFSVTLGFIRNNRVIWRRTDGQFTTADELEDEDFVIVNQLNFAAAGWATTGDALLANTSAALARERRQAGREELAHHAGTAHLAMPTAA